MAKITLIIDGISYDCVPRIAMPVESPWVFPVGEGDYPPERWYCAVWHDLTGKRNTNGYKHSGIDLNLDVSPWGDVERSRQLGIFAIADGVVTYSTPNWSGVPMVVIRHKHADLWLWVRYGHVLPVVQVGDVVSSGQRLGTFANWRTGDHLHFDMAIDPFTREWLDPAIRWFDPVPVLKAHLDMDTVDAMLRKGG